MHIRSRTDTDKRDNHESSRYLRRMFWLGQRDMGGVPVYDNVVAETHRAKIANPAVRVSTQWARVEIRHQLVQSRKQVVAGLLDSLALAQAGKSGHDRVADRILSKMFLHDGN